MSANLIPNRPTEKGRRMGRELVRLWKAAMRAALVNAPAEALAAVPDRCKTCAFREGTHPNGCEETVMDAVKCVLEKVPFSCHQELKDGKPTKLCAGWIVTQRCDQPPVKVSWDWTDPEMRRQKRT